MPLLFAATLFASALLLFMVQPMVGKMILHLLGGSPAAWNTCMVFFQALLLLGYLYSHRLAGRGDRTAAMQGRVHMAVLGGAVAWLVLAALLLSPKGNPIPVLASLAPQGEAYPMFGALALLTVAIGVPFFVLSTTSPLLQKWFALTKHPAGRDPYFLSATSNAGSLLSLLAYPFVVEPSLTLGQQAWLWAGGFVVFTVLVAFCAQAAANPLPPIRGGLPAPVDAVKPLPPAPLPRRKIVRWVLLAFVPSSLMLGVTFHMTTDIASVPLLWAIPLAMYLVTFILAFSKWTQVWWYRPLLANISPVVTLLLIFVMTAAIPELTTGVVLSLHLLAFFFAALMLHSELAHDRPPPEHLTDFWLWISVGGVLGGMFNALFAPVFFPTALEYPVAIALGCMLVPKLVGAAPEPAAPADPERRSGLAPLADLLIPLAMLTAVSWLVVLPDQRWFAGALDSVAGGVTRAFQFSGVNFGVQGKFFERLLIYALPCVLCFLFIDRPVRFGLCVAAILAVWSFGSANSAGVLKTERSFFGILRVEQTVERWRCFDYLDPEGAPGGAAPALEVYRHSVYFNKLSHGTTLHGEQGAIGYSYPLVDNVPALAPDPWGALTLTAMAGVYRFEDVKQPDGSTERQPVLVRGAYDFRQDPLTYYHRAGPVGGIFWESNRRNPLGSVAMVGLGSGSVSCYAKRDQELTFYEIDPTVIKLVEPDRYFTYLHDAKRRGAKVRFVLGDARLKLEENKDARYDLLLVDAFSSDSIPVHLLTREAVKLYTERLTEHGLLAVHISNRYIDLEPVVARLATDLGLTARVWNDQRTNDYPGKTMSTWVILAKRESDLSDAVIDRGSDVAYGALAGGYGYNVFNIEWRPLKLMDDVPAWTDDFSDVLRVMRLKEVQRVRRFLGFPTPVTE